MIRHSRFRATRGLLLTAILPACATSPPSQDEVGDADVAPTAGGSTSGGAPTGAGAADDGTEIAAYVCPPTDLFEHALCICEDFDQVGALTVAPGPSGTGAVGVNGFTRFVNSTLASGSWIAYKGFEAVAAATIGNDLVTAFDAHWVGLLRVGGDLAVGGDATGVGLLQLAGDLRVAGREAFLGLAQVTARAPFQPLEGPPCGCDPETFFDVESAVAAASTVNDNAAIGLDEAVRSIGVADIRLPTGTYYLEDATVIGLARFVIEGDVSLHVDGDVDAIGASAFALEDGATLDLFVSGSVRTVGLLATGDAIDPSAFRLYVGGGGDLLVGVGLQRYHGNIYAPEARIGWVGATRVVGSLFARSLVGVGLLEIRYGAPGSLEPDDCDEEQDEDSGYPENPYEDPTDGSSGYQVE